MTAAARRARSNGAPTTLDEALAQQIAFATDMAQRFGGEITARNAERNAEHQARIAASAAEAEAEGRVLRLELVDRLPAPLREAARAYLLGETARADELAKAVEKVDRDAIDWQLAEDIAVREPCTDDSHEKACEDWRVPGLAEHFESRPIAPGTLRAELKTLVAKVNDLLSRWCVTEQVCGEDGEDGMLGALMTADAALRRALASERLRVIEQHAALVGLAEHHPDVLAALSKVRSITFDNGILAAAYALLVIDAPGRGAVDAPGDWYLRMADIDAGMAS